MTILYTVKKQLTGSAFTRLMKKKKTNKYRITKATGISYPTLSNWESGLHWPKNETAEIVGRYLGLIPDDDRVIELERQAAEIKETLARLR